MKKTITITIDGAKMGMNIKGQLSSIEIIGALTHYKNLVEVDLLSKVKESLPEKKKPIT